MSIANEIQRLQTAKLDIKTAIENKGVTVGDGTIDTYADLIKQISSGEGLKYTSGTVEFADKENTIFYHNLGKVPRTILIWTEPAAEPENACLGAVYTSIMPLTLSAVLEDRTTSRNYAVTTGGITNVTETSAQFLQRSNNYPIKIGVTYNWLVIE